eukprot:11478290-Ditylum_brightwellii.AAC.2
MVNTVCRTAASCWHKTTDMRAPWALCSSYWLCTDEREVMAYFYSAPKRFGSRSQALITRGGELEASLYLKEYGVFFSSAPMQWRDHVLTVGIFSMGGAHPMVNNSSLVTARLLCSALKSVLICITQEDEEGKLEALPSTSLLLWMLIHHLPPLIT